MDKAMWNMDETWEMKIIFKTVKWIEQGKIAFLPWKLLQNQPVDHPPVQSLHPLLTVKLYIFHLSCLDLSDLAQEILELLAISYYFWISCRYLSSILLLICKDNDGVDFILRLEDGVGLLR